MKSTPEADAEPVENVTCALWPEHVSLLRDRAISVEFAIESGLRSVDCTKLKAHCEKYKKEPPYPQLPLHRGATGILIGYPNTGSDGIPRGRIRVDSREITLPGPMEGSHHGEVTVTVPRYVCQKGVKVIPYILPSVSMLAGDVSKALFFVEAPLKAMSLTANGMPAIGLGGIYAGATNREALDALGEILISKEMTFIKWKCRVVYVSFDAGLTDNPQVAQAAARLALALLHEGAEVRVVTTPYAHPADTDPHNGTFYFKNDQGPDDFLAREGVDAFKALVEAAVPASPVIRISQAAAGSNRTEATSSLLGELFFQAMLHEGGALLIDQVAVVAKMAGVGKKAVQQAAKSFADRLSRHSQQDRAEWKSDLKRSSSGALRPITLNVETCIRRDPPLEGLVAWDDFRQCVIFRREPPWADHYADARGLGDGAPWADDDDTRLSGYLGRTQDLLDVAPQKIQAALNVVAKDRRFHPVREYLSSLKWDGTSRLDSFPARYLGANADLGDYYKVISPKWFVSAVARVYQPGCKVDHTLVLEGEQGDNKTSVFRALGGDWYSDASQDDLASKEAAMKLQGAWIFVFDEGSILTRADAVQMKEFLTKEVDEIIPKFSNRKVKFKRQCAFALTTNEYTYLSDATGNRRFWPIAVGVVDLEGLTLVRDQLWAEAVHRYKADENWWPTKKEEETLIAPEQDKRRRIDPWEPRIAEALKDKQDTTVEYVMSNVLEHKLKDEDQGVRLRVVRCLRSIGWKFGGIRKVNGVAERFYVCGGQAGELSPTRRLSMAQEALAMAFADGVPVTMSLERRPSGVVVRVWREQDPLPGVHGMPQVEMSDLIDMV